MNHTFGVRGTRLALLIGLLAAVGPSVAGPGTHAARRSPEAAEAHAHLDQHVLPALDARRQAADARAEAMGAWFSGELDAPAAALPEVAGLPLLDAGIAWSAVRALDKAAERRAAERVAPLPTDLDPDDRDRYRAARSATLDAEDAADSQVRRFWLGLAAAAEAAPKLRPSAIAARRALLQERAPTPKNIGPEGIPDDIAAGVLARGQAEGALARLEAAAVRAATIPDDPALDTLVRDDLSTVRGWLALVADRSVAPPAAVADAADRLDRVGSLTQEPLTEVREAWQVRAVERSLSGLERELAELQARLEAGAPAQSVTVEVAEKQLELARQGVVDARAAWTSLGGSLNKERVPTPGLDVLQALLLQESATRLRCAEVRVQLAERSLDAARQLAAMGVDHAETTDDDVAQAKADAEIALAEAERAAEEGGLSADAELRDQIARYSARRAEVLEARKALEQEAKDERKALTEGLSQQRTESAAALSLGPLDKDRQNRLDTVYGEARSLVNQARAHVTGRKKAETSIRDATDVELDQLPEPAATVPSEADSALVSHWQDELGKLRFELARNRDIASREVDSAMEVLSETKEFRRLTRVHASSQARAVIQSRFIDELIEEFREIPSIVVSLVRQTFATVRQLPTLLLDLGAVAAFFRGSFELVVLVLLWGVGRERSGQWLGTGLRTLRAVRPGDLGLAARINDWVGTRGVAGDWLALEDTVTPILRRMVDGGAGYLVYHALPAEWSMVRLVVFFWLARTAWLIGTDLVPVLLTVPGEDRPAVRQINAANRLQALRTVQVVLGWLLLDALFSRVALEVLDADRLHDLVAWASTVAGWVLLLGILHVWAPDLRDAVAKDPDDPMGRLLARQSDSTLLRAPLAGLASAILLIQWMSGVASSLVEQRSGLAWVRTAMARQSLKNTEDAPTAQLDATLMARLEHFDPSVVSTDAEAAELESTFDAWRNEGRRGMVAITGQRGSGKSRLLRRIPTLLGPETGGLPVRRVRLDRDIFDADDALAWLVCSLTDTEPAPAVTDPDQAVELLAALPPTVFVIDDLHRCFLRAVGGFRGLRQVLTAMHAVSDRHFWVCAFHGDNWAFLEGVGHAVNLGVFRTRLSMQPMTPSALRDWLEGHTLAMGITPTYDDLAAEGWMGSDPERTRERARNAYFRLLAESTRGNPRVALATWCKSLRRGTADGTAAVVLFEPPGGEILTQGGEHALFVLSALVVHDGLDVADLVRVLNLDVSTCRATCRRLEGLGVLDSDAAKEHYDIAMTWAPAVHRHLRRKHLLHRE